MHAGKATNLGDLVDRNADNDKTAFIEIGETGETGRYTHAEIDRLSEEFAAALQAGGYRPGENIGIVARNSVSFLVAYLGTMRAGLIAVPVNFRQPPDMIAHCLTDSAVRLILTDGVVDLPDIGVPVISLGADMADTIAGGTGSRKFSRHDNKPRDVAMVLYTSGSTGPPKGVELSHESQLFALSVFEPQRAFAERQILSIAAPLYHMNALSLSKLTLLMNSTAVLFSSFDAERVIRAIPRYRIGWLTGIPTMYALMAAREDLMSQTDLSCVERVTLGSSPLTDNLLALLQRSMPEAKYTNSYGTTEHGPAAFAPHPDGRPTPALSLGVTAPGVETRLVGGPDDSFGVLEVRSPANMNGYRNLPEVTAKRLVDGWYHTGDLFRRDEDGFYFFVGRADDMFVVNGENVHPLDVEKVLERHPAIRQACVVPVDDPIRGAAPVAFVTGDAHVSEAEIQNYYRQHGRAVETPRKIIFVDTLPLAGTNKVDRKAVQEWARDIQVAAKA